MGITTHTCAQHLVALKSKKQSAIARASNEEEFRSIAQEICEILWMKQVLKDLKIQCESFMKLFAIINWLAHSLV